MLMDGERPQQQQLEQRQQIDGPSIRDVEYAVNHVLVDTKSMNISQCETANSHLIGSHMTTATTNANTSVAQDVSMVDVKVKIETDVKVKIEMEVTDVNMAKKRRGRPPRSQEKTAVPPRQPQQTTLEDEEDVCFICLDGGDLVLCDRRGCPKAYHPACIKRDESFFRSKAKWNCGWHICSCCQKTSHYVCYTCTYSLCKRCAKESDYLCVRENKGFCGVCMKTIMLIENIALGNQEQVKVDFDDKTSWEYYFKVYWISLKEKLSLTVDELTKAKNPGREEQLRTRTYWGKTNSYLKRGSLRQLQYCNGENSSENCSSQVAIHDCKRRKTDNQLMDLNINASQMMTDDDQRFKTQMKTDEMRPSINLNVDEDAAIDVHNVRLLYVKRNLMEDLMDDAENFREKVVGSFVRIKVSGGGQEQDLHRVVQVVGTSKVAQSYRVGARTTDIVLEILNLNKKEVISIDIISDEEFSEEECKHFQQSTKCGLIKKLTVGEVVRKARMLQHVKLSDFLEAEISQLKHLPTQAIEMGKQKELRDYMEKLECLKSSNEGQGDHVTQRNSLNGRDDSASIRKGEAFDLNDVKRPKNQVGSLSGAINPNNKESLSSSATPKIVLALSAKERSPRDSETEKIWQYRDPARKIQGPFSKTQLRIWSDKGLFPLDLRTWSIFDKEEVSVLLTDALFGQSNKATPRTCNGHLPSLDIAYSSNDSGLSHNQEVAWLNNQKADHTWTSMRTDANGHFNSSDESLRSNECSHSSSWTPPTDASVTRDEQAQSSLQILDINKSTKSLVDRSEICGPHPIASSSAKLRKESHQSEKPGFSEIDVNANSPMTFEDSTKVRKGEDKHGKSFLSGSDSNFGMSMAKSIGKLEQNHAADVPNLPNAAPTQSQKDLKGQATVNKKPVSSNALVNDPGPAGSPASSFEAAKALLDLFSDFGGSSITAAKPSPKEWDTNTVSTSSPKLPEGANDHAPTPTSGNDNLTTSSPTHPPKLPEGVKDHTPTPNLGKDCLTLSSPALPNPNTTLPNPNPNLNLIPTPSPTPALNLSPDLVPNPPHPNPTLLNPNPPHSNPTLSNPNPPPSNPTIDALGWQPIIPETNEFCPLVDESVSDLLAEVEAMESMGGLPSPTSKMTSPGGLMQDSDFFSPLDGLNSASEARRAEILSFTQMLFEFDDDEQMQLSNMRSSQSIVTESTGIPQISTQLAITSNPLQESHASSQSAVTEQHGASKMPSHYSSMNKPPEQSHTNLHDYFSGHSSAGAMDRDPKPNDSLIRTLKEGLEIHPPSTDREKTYSNVQPFTSSPVFPWDPISDVQLPESSASGTSWGTVKENLNFGQDVRQVNTNMSWGNSGVVQQHTNVDAVNWNPGGWANQPREYGNRVNSGRDNRISYHGRDSSGVRDRSSWNRQSHHGSGNGGSYRTPPKGQRICKFSENGYCKRGAACCFWHP